MIPLDRSRVDDKRREAELVEVRVERQGRQLAFNEVRAVETI